MHSIVLRLLQAECMPAVFDLEGTLVDLETLHFLCFELALGDQGVAMTVKEITAISGVIGGGDPFIARALGERYGLSAELILAQKRKHFAQMIQEHTMTPRPGAIDFLTLLADADIPMALASLTPRHRGEEILKRSGLTRFFPTKRVLFREDVTNHKPHPEVYEQAARCLGVSPFEQIVFEDSPVGVRAAKAAGSRVIALPAPLFHEEVEHLRALRQAGADAVYLHWTNVHRFPLLPLMAKNGV